MSGAGRALFCFLQNSVLFRGATLNGIKITLVKGAPQWSVLSTSQTWRCLQTPADSEDRDVSKPIKFSTSRASHRTWRVKRSLGSKFQQPWWKVLPFSFIGIVFLVWCIFRGESEVDSQLEKQLPEQVPGLQSEDTEE